MKMNILRTVAPYGAVLLISAALVTPAHAVLDDFDPFDYSDIALAGQAGGTGWQNGWFQTSGSQPNQVSNDSVSLSYPATFEAPFTTPAISGSRVYTGGSSAIASTSRLLAQTIPLNVDGTTRYVSALIRKNSTNGGGVTNDSILLEFVDSAGNRRWGVGIEGTGDHPWLNANGSTTASGPAVTVGNTYFMVAKIVSSASGSDQTFLKVFGDGYASQVPVAEPTSWDATLNESTGAILDRVRVRIDPANTVSTPGEVDEIRIATTWAEAVGQVVPSLNGDFNSDGKVDAGDYVTWAKNNGTNNALPHDNGLGTPIGPAHYDLWRANFGNPSGSGSSLVGASVPEPAAWLLVSMAAAVLTAAARHRAIARLVLEPVHCLQAR